MTCQHVKELTSTQEFREYITKRKEQHQDQQVPFEEDKLEETLIQIDKEVAKNNQRVVMEKVSQLVELVEIPGGEKHSSEVAGQYQFDNSR